MNDLDYCSRCNRLFSYLDLKPYDLKWYCKKCYKEVIAEEPVAKYT
ncbi:MAG: hypothetical protein ACRD38_13025 [Nitrososphaerales archaeon]